MLHQPRSSSSNAARRLADLETPRDVPPMDVQVVPAEREAACALAASLVTAELDTVVAR
jgi:hypothetical protein